jgi:hypothetical protein
MMAEVTNNSAEGMDVKIELARIEMKGKEASVTFRVSTDSGPGPHFEIDFLVLAHNGLDDALAASQMALRLFVAGLAEAAKKPTLSSLVSQSSGAAG